MIQADVVEEKARKLAQVLVEEIREFPNLNDLRRILACAYYEGFQDGLKFAQGIYSPDEVA